MPLAQGEAEKVVQVSKGVHQGRTISVKAGWLAGALASRAGLSRENAYAVVSPDDGRLSFETVEQASGERLVHVLTNFGWPHPPDLDGLGAGSRRAGDDATPED